MIASIASRSVPPFIPLAAWFAICAGLVVWAVVSSRRDLMKEIDRLEATLKRNEAHEVTVRSTEMIEFEEEEDEGACYAFQLKDDRIVFIVGQEYYPSAKFPNTDFSLVSIQDGDGRCIEELIYKRGHKLKPCRMIPAKFKSEMFLPDHLEVIRGKLSELEGLLTATYQDRGWRTANRA